MFSKMVASQVKFKNWKILNQTRKELKTVEGSILDFEQKRPSQKTKTYECSGITEIIRRIQ